ncbi:glycosyltransferase family 2 protein [Haloarcula sp. GH36]|uniref:glycosyltransferase family 2 protein n=1 Tax=Haloarcula montana TaxID=3111776 RepID=UPI002D77CF80|nr:glycosyltransferase family 2 protein [Haloarcula sp. GH36]
MNGVDSPPRVSVVIPTYNRADTVRRAIESALAQTVTDIEVVVVDDGSTDDTAAVVAGIDDERVRYITHEGNRGRSVARNTGIDAARGEYVAFLDSDDHWLPGKLERQLDELSRRSPEWIGVYCEFLTPKPSALGRTVDWLSREVFAAPNALEGGRELAREILTVNVLMGPGSTLLVEREALLATDGFDEQLVDHEDWDLVLQLLARGKIAYVDEALVVVPSSGGDPSPEELVDNKRRFLSRHADLIREFEAEGTHINRTHRLHIVAVFFQNGRFREGLAYLQPDALLEPKNWVRLAWWGVMGTRRRLKRAGAAGGR